MSSADQRIDTRTVLLLVGGTACFASGLPVSEVVADAIPLWASLGARAAIGALVLAAVVAVRTRASGASPLAELRALGRRGLVGLLVLGVVGTVLLSLALVTGARRTTGTVGAAALGLSPALAALGASLFLREHVGRWRRAAVGLAVGAVVVVGVATHRGALLDAVVLVGVGLLLVAAVCDAAYTVLGKHLLRSLHPTTLALGATLVGALCFAPVAVVQAVSVGVGAPTTGEWLALAWWGAGATALGAVLWFSGVARVPVATVAPFMALLPVTAPVFSAVVLAEALRWVHPAALVLVGLAVAVAIVGDRRDPREVQPRWVQEWWRGLLTGFWFVPALCTAASVVAALGLIGVDLAVGDDGPPRWSYRGTPDGAREALTTISSSMITFTGLVFSITVLSIQLTSSQFSPRALRNFLQDRTSQFALGLFVSTFTYSFVALAAVRAATEDDDAFVPSITIVGAFVLIAASLGFFIHFIHHTAQSLRAISLIDRIATETSEVHDRLYPDPPDRPPLPWRDGPLEGEGSATAVTSARAGVVTAVDLDALAASAARHDVVAVLVVQVGAFVCSGARLMELRPSREGLDGHGWQRFVRVEPERTMHDDPTFGLRQLVDIAERGLSPGITDPTTAVQCVHRIHDLLRRIATRAVPTSRLGLHDGQVRAVLPSPSFGEMFELAVEEVMHWGRDSIQVHRQLGVMFDDLLAMELEPQRREVVLRYRLALEPAEELSPLGRPSGR